MAWVYLLIAGLLEIGWAIGLKYTDGWTRLVPSLLTGIGMVASFYFLSLAVRTLPIGTAYAVWTGIGTLGATILGVVIFQEPRDAAKWVCIALIIVGILGLKLSHKNPQQQEEVWSEKAAASNAHPGVNDSVPPTKL